MAIITKLAFSTRKKDYVNIFLDDEFFVQVHIDIVTKHGLKKSMELPEELRNHVIDDKRTVQVKQAALRFVCYKPRTEQQVRERLRIREFTSEEINLAIAFLFKFDYLNDAEYCRMFINDYLLRKNTSAKKVTMELKKRGVTEKEICEAIELYYPKDETYQMAIAAAKKKMRAIQFKSVDKQKKSVSDYLQREGFDWNMIKQVVNELFTID